MTRMSSVVIPSTTKAWEKPFTNVKERVHSPRGTSCWDTEDSGCAINVYTPSEC